MAKVSKDSDREFSEEEIKFIDNIINIIRIQLYHVQNDPQNAICGFSEA